MGELRPVGTKFKDESPPAFNGTDSRWMRITYEVAAHVKVATDMRNGFKMAEELKATDIEYFDKPNRSLIFENGSLRYDT